MKTVVPIVEGHGEVFALPPLLRKLSAWISPSSFVNVATPIRTNKSKFLNDPDEFGKMLKLASYKAGDDGWIVLMLDADDDCPMELASEIESRARKIMDTSNLSIVIPNREYEAWFIAAAASLEGCRGLRLRAELAVDDPDRPRNAKGWLAKQMPDGYHEVTDQPAFSASMNLEQAWLRSRSFRRLCAEFVRHSHNMNV